MRKRSWEGVHKVGTDCTVFYAIVLPGGRDFAQAPDFDDFEPRIILELPDLGEISPSFPVDVNLVSFGTVSSPLNGSLCL